MKIALVLLAIILLPAEAIAQNEPLGCKERDFFWDYVNNGTVGYSRDLMMCEFGKWKRIGLNHPSVG